MIQDTGIEQGVFTVLRKYVNKEELQLSTNMDTLSIDSLTLIEIVFELEKEFNIVIPDRAHTIGAEFRTIGSLIEAVTNAKSGSVEG